MVNGNRFYLREEDRWRRRFFKTPPNVFDSIKFLPNDPRIRSSEGQSVEELSLALDATRQQISDLGKEREQLFAKASTLERELRIRGWPPTSPGLRASCNLPGRRIRGWLSSVTSSLSKSLASK